MDIPEENTVVLNMMGEFNNFLLNKFEKSKQEQSERMQLGERLSDKSRIARLESELEGLKRSSKRARVETEKEQSKESEEKKQLEKQVQDLRSKIALLVKRDEKISEELSLAKSSKDTLRKQYDEQIRDLKDKKLKVETALQDLQLSTRSHISKLKNEISRKDSEQSMLKTTLEQTKTQLHQQMRKAVEAGANRRTLEEYKAELYQIKQTNKELLLQIEENKDAVSLAKAVGNDVTRLPQLEEENKRLTKENEYLRATNENNYLLKEKVVGLEAKLSRTENRLTEMARLQVVNEELEEKNARSEAMISKLTKDGSNHDSNLDELKKKIKDLEEKNQEQNEIIQMYKDQKNMKGDFDPTKTKVLSFAFNPAAELKKKREEEERKLQEEVEMLRERVRILEEMGNDANTQEIKVQLERRNSKEVDDLKKELQASELRTQRLKEVFKRKIHDLREACYRLTGYLINNPSDNQYNLISMYAEQQSDMLLFRSTPEGEMQLLENDFSSSLPDFIEDYLKQQDSIPAFLSSITLDLFSKQTTMIMGQSLM